MLCDTHCDTLFRRMEGKYDSLDINLDIMKKSGLTLQIFAMFVGYDNRMEIVKKQNLLMLEEFEALKNEGLNHVIQLSQLQEDTINGMLSLEGCECIEDEKSLAFYLDKGVRMAAVTWNFENQFAYPAYINQDKGLKPYGKEMLKEMQKQHIAIDVSHLNEAGFFELIENFDRPILASHSNAAALCPHVRNLSDDQLKVLFEKGGYIGINFWPTFLSPNKEADLDIVIDHMFYMMELGGENHIGFGSDFDGIGSKPKDLENPLGFPKLLERMRQRGLSEANIEKISGKNLLEYFSRI